MDTAQTYFLLTILLPLLGGMFTYTIGGKKGINVAVAAMGGGFVMSLILLLSVIDQPWVIRWKWVPGIELGWNIDTTAAVLMSLVSFISLLVHLFSKHYMFGDKAIDRYYGKLGFFTFSMLGLLASDHFLLLFIFWELVGFSSFLLIGFWFDDIQKAQGARKAFMINRVADAGLLIGVILLVVELDVNFISELKEMPFSPMLQLAGFGLMIGAFGKSAQFPFFGWLPKAMAGPTPVSALIHAATMVAAGVYLLFRTQEILTPDVLAVTAFVGGLTALMAAIAALTQFDIKKVLAYSTISQLGYMVMGVGVGAYESSLFHLWTHAFFKAGLFLTAGAVIHYYHHAHHHCHRFDAQDMRNMGGLRKILPVTFIAFLINGMALSGLPFFSGFLSKEGILSGALIWAVGHGNAVGYLVVVMAFVTAALTPFYIGRQILLVFFGESRTVNKPVEGMEPIFSVKLTLLILAVASIWIFSALNPFDGHGWWLGNLLFDDHVMPDTSHQFLLHVTMALSVILVISGLALSYRKYKPDSAVVLRFKTKQRPKGLLGKLSFNAWYIEDIYEKISDGFLNISKTSFQIDKKIIDRSIDLFGVSTVVFAKAMAIVDREIVDGLVNFAAWVSRTIGNAYTKVHAARVQNQLLWLVLFIIVIVLWLQF